MSELESAADVPTEADTSPNAKRRKGCGCWTILLVCLATPLVLGALGYGWWRWSSSARLERAIAAVREKGEPTTIEELNALYPATPESQRATDLWFAAAEAAAMDAQRGTELSKFLAWAQGPNDRVDGYLPTWPTDPSGALAPEALKVAEDFLAGREGALEAARRAVEEGGTTQFLVEDERASQTEERWSRYRIFELLSLEAEVRRTRGDAAGVGESIRTALALAEMLREEPDPIVQVRRLDSVSKALDQIEKSLVRDELSDVDLADLQRRLAKITYEPSLHASMLTMQMREIRMSRGLEDVDPMYVPYRYSPEASSALALEWIALWVEKATDYPGAEAAEAALDDAERSLFLSGSEPAFVRFIWTVRFGEGASRGGEPRWVWLRCSQQEGNVDLVEMAIACVRYRREYGVVPPDAAALVPAFLDAIPEDVRYWVRTSEPLCYLPTEKGFIVYSRGLDGRDDGATLNENGYENDWPLRIESDRYAPPPEPDYSAGATASEESGSETSDAAESETEGSEEESEEADAPAEQP